MAGVRFKVTTGTYKTDVKFVVLSPEGKEEQMSFQAEFKRMNQDDVKAMVKASGGDREMARQVLVGWRMRDIDSGESIPFSIDTLEEFLTIPGAGGVTIMRFMETVGASREKN